MPRLSEMTREQYLDHCKTLMKDITAPAIVEILIRRDGKVVWINVDGVCAFRACQIGHLIVNGTFGG